MTEIEMEVDMAKPHDLGVHIDDDILDFDTDMHDQHESNSTHFDANGLQTEPHTIPEEIHIDIDSEELQVEPEGDEEMSEEVDLGDAEETIRDVDDTVNDVDQDIVQNDFGTEEHGQTVEQRSQGDGDDYVEVSHIIDEDGNNNNNTTDEIDEIDYEIGESLEKQESREERESNMENISTHDVEEANQNVEVVEAEPPREEVVVGQGEAQSEHGDATEETEITYDEADAQEHEEPLGQDDETANIENATEIVNNEFDEVHTEDENVSTQDEDARDNLAEVSVLQGEVSENVEFDAYDAPVHGDHGEEADEEQDEEQDEERDEEHDEEHGEEHNDGQDDQVATGDFQHAPSPSDQNSVVVSNEEFPAITVQYKGDEFPFFSHTSNGFFTDTSILDETMDKVLSGFREELSSEICHEDELVFQVDELGLEFAESSWRDSLSSVTLRQILEIFDLLVKNQDPDSSRTLYAYLFTKPCASKRLESLIESATAGKGLDEVIHLFESPVPVSTRLLDPETIDNGPAEYLDEYDSPTAETDGIHHEELDHDTQDAVGGDDEEEEGEQSAHDDYADENDAEPNSEDLPPVQDEATDAVALEEHDETNAHDESESNPFINLELDNEVEEDEVDLEADGVTDEQNSVDPEEDNQGTAGTSATTTLKDEDETGSIIVDISADLVSTEPGDIDEAGNEDQLEEIDWRDEPDADDEVQSPRSVAGKRARADDDELDVEDEQDVKRRRP